VVLVYSSHIGTTIFGDYRQVAAPTGYFVQDKATGASSSDHNREVAALTGNHYRQIPLGIDNLLVSAIL